MRELELREKNKYIFIDLGIIEFNCLMIKYGIKMDYVNFFFYGVMFFEDEFDKEKMREIILV